MSKRLFSMISPAVWRSERFQSVNCEAQVLHLYFMTCDHQNGSGCYRLPDGYACADLGWELDEYLKARGELEKTRLIIFDRGTSSLFIDKWFKYCTPQNDKHAISIKRQIDDIESDTLRNYVSDQFELAEAARRSLREETRLTSTGYMNGRHPGAH